jgi:hypothetical protein
VAERRLGYAEFSGGSGEAAFLGNGQEHSEGAEILTAHESGHLVS